MLKGKGAGLLKGLRKNSAVEALDARASQGQKWGAAGLARAASIVTKLSPSASGEGGAGEEEGDDPLGGEPAPPIPQYLEGGDSSGEDYDPGMSMSRRAHGNMSLSDSDSDGGPRVSFVGQRKPLPPPPPEEKRSYVRFSEPEEDVRSSPDLESAEVDSRRSFSSEAVSSANSSRESTPTPDNHQQGRLASPVMELHPKPAPPPPAAHAPPTHPTPAAPAPSAPSTPPRGKDGEDPSIQSPKVSKRLMAGLLQQAEAVAARTEGSFASMKSQYEEHLGRAERAADEERGQKEEAQEEVQRLKERLCQLQEQAHAHGKSADSAAIQLVEEQARANRSEEMRASTERRLEATTREALGLIELQDMSEYWFRNATRCWMDWVARQETFALEHLPYTPHTTAPPAPAQPSAPIVAPQDTARMARLEAETERAEARLIEKETLITSLKSTIAHLQNQSVAARTGQAGDSPDCREWEEKYNAASKERQALREHALEVAEAAERQAAKAERIKKEAEEGMAAQQHLQGEVRRLRVELEDHRSQLAGKADESRSLGRMAEQWKAQCHSGEEELGRRGEELRVARLEIVRLRESLEAQETTSSAELRRLKREAASSEDRLASQQLECAQLSGRAARLEEELQTERELSKSLKRETSQLTMDQLGGERMAAEMARLREELGVAKAEIGTQNAKLREQQEFIRSATGKERRSKERERERQRHVERSHVEALHAEAAAAEQNRLHLEQQLAHFAARQADWEAERQQLHASIRELAGALECSETCARQAQHWISVTSSELMGLEREGLISHEDALDYQQYS